LEPDLSLHLFSRCPYVRCFTFISQLTVKEFPVGEQTEGAEKTPMVLENWKIWLTVLAALILAAYSAPFMDMFQNGPPPSKGFRVW
jgi:hypothetical protein